MLQKVVIGCLVFLAAFGIGSFLGYDASSRHPVAKALDSLRQSRRAVRPKLVRDYPVGDADVYGEWGWSDREPFIRLTPTEITDVQNGEVYRYRLVSRVDDSYQNRYLIEIEGLKPGSTLRNFVSLRFSDDGWVAFHGYGRLEDVDKPGSTAMYSLTKVYRSGK